MRFERGMGNEQKAALRFVRFFSREVVDQNTPPVLSVVYQLPSPIASMFLVYVSSNFFQSGEGLLAHKLIGYLQTTTHFLQVSIKFCVLWVCSKGNYH